MFIILIIKLSDVSKQNDVNVGGNVNEVLIKLLQIKNINCANVFLFHVAHNLSRFSIASAKTDGC